MASALAATRDWIDSLGPLDPYAEVLAASALALAANVDDPPPTESGYMSIAPFANSLRATISQLREVAGARGDDEGGWGEVIPLTSASA